MKVSHDFTITETDVVIDALRIYVDELIERNNPHRSAVAQLMSNMFSCDD